MSKAINYLLESPTPVVEPPVRRPTTPVRRPQAPPTPKRSPLMPPAERPFVKPRPKAQLRRASAEVMGFLKKRGKLPAEKETDIRSFSEFFNHYAGYLVVENVEQMLTNLVKKDQKVPEEDIPHIIQADPSPNKIYVKWIYAQAAIKNINLSGGEDVEKIADVLRSFMRFKGSSRFVEYVQSVEPDITQPGNIFQYSTAQELMKLLGDFADKFNTMSREELKRGEFKSSQGMQLLNQVGDLKLWKIASVEIANKVLQKGPQCRGNWCVKDPQYFKSYVNPQSTNGGDGLYLIQRGDKFVALFDCVQFDFRDENDKSVAPRDIAKLYGALIKPVLSKIFNSSGS